jgi:hypothetical protein
MNRHKRSLTLIILATLASLGAERPAAGQVPLPSKVPNRVFVEAPPAVHFGADFRPMNVDSCTRKAMDAMWDQKFFEGTRTGPSAWGFNAQSLVLVRCVPQTGGVFIEVFAASRSDSEAERLRNEIRISVFDSRAPGDMAYHNAFSVGPFEGTRAQNPPAVHWGFDTRPKSVQSCMSGAKLAMSRTGLTSSPAGENLMWGTSRGATVLVSCVAIDAGVSILVAATSQDGATAEDFRNRVRTITFDSVLHD